MIFYNVSATIQKLLSTKRCPYTIQWPKELKNSAACSFGATLHLQAIALVILTVPARLRSFPN